MTVAPQADTEVVHGIIQGVVHKGEDKYQVEVNIGQQNPRRLWTKDMALVQTIMQMIGQQQSFLCGVSHWNRNDGTPVRSLWINGMGPGVAAPQPAMQVSQPVAPPPVAPQPQPQQMWPQPQAPTVVQPQVAPMGPVANLSPPQSSFVSQDQKEDRIHRQTATKVASILISHVPAEQRTLDNVLALAERLVAYYENGLAQAAMNGDPGEQGNPPHTDDDIPF